MNLHDLYTHCLYPHHAECIETRSVIMYTGVIMHYCKKNNLFGGQGNSKRRCRYMHFNKSSLVPHPEETIVC